MILGWNAFYTLNILEWNLGSIEVNGKPTINFSGTRISAWMCLFSRLVYSRNLYWYSFVTWVWKIHAPGKRSYIDLTHSVDSARLPFGEVDYLCRLEKPCCWHRQCLHWSTTAVQLCCYSVSSINIPLFSSTAKIHRLELSLFFCCHKFYS